MIKMLKSKWTWIIAGLLILMYTIVVQQLRIRNLQDSIQLQAVELSMLNDSVEVLESKNGELTYQLNSVSVDKRNLKESLELAGYEIKELKRREINYKKINSALQLELNVQGSGHATIVDTIQVINGVDTATVRKFKWTNNYLALNGSIDNRLNFNYLYKSGIQIIQYNKKRQTMVAVILDDPNASITTGNNIIVRKERKWYEKPWVWGVAGLAGGVFIAK
ncbi:MAG: hypothetical protein JXR54_10020 [Tannerellaceae bacterium]|nr:hypothetical protein [Tannerellaceae bacterium]